MDTAAIEKAELSIRTCVATPSRVVLVFEGETGPAAAEETTTYLIKQADTPLRPFSPSAAEYDPDSRVAVLRNPVEVKVADWLQVTVLSPPTGPPITHFVRVESELSVQRAGLLEAALRNGTGKARGVSGQPNAFDPLDHGASDKRETAPRAASRRRRTVDLPPALVVVLAGLVALVILGVVAMTSAASGDMGTIATAAFGVIGSVIGAFFGVHVGLGDRRRVERERQLEATKGQMLAAMMPEDKKQAALDVLKDYAANGPTTTTS